MGNEEYNLLFFVLWGIFLPLIATIGLVGNILTIIVLWRKEMHSTIFLYLRALAVTDTGILIFSVINLTPIGFYRYLHGDALDYIEHRVYPLLQTPCYYIVMTLQQCNVWITVSVSIERYIAICHPLRAAKLITRRKTIIVIISIIVVSLIYNTPHLLATHIVECPVNATATANLSLPNSTVSSLFPSSSSVAPLSDEEPSYTCLQLVSTEFGLSSIYITFRTRIYAVVIHSIPLITLVILNSFLIKELMVMRQRRTVTNINEENEANLSLVLVLIVIVFILCQTPGLISQFVVMEKWTAVSNFLFALNSAVNFLIYTAFGRNYRKVLLVVFRHVLSKRSKAKASSSSYRAWQYTINDYEMSNVGDSSTSKRGNNDGVRICTSQKYIHCNGTESEQKPL